MTKIILPELGEGIVHAQVVRWIFQEGQQVTRDDDVVELVTDKAVFNIASPGSGTITRILCHEGAEVPVGAVLAEME